MRISTAIMTTTATLGLLIGPSLLPLATSASAWAQDTSTLNPVHRAPARISWQLSVLLDDKEVDHFDAVTPVGQSKTLTHTRAASNPVGCEGGHTTPVNLSRTITVAPLGVDAQGVIGFELSADETVESTEAGVVRSDGCTLPPQPRAINAHHPELDVQTGQSVTWTLLKHDPALVYRIEASVQAPSPND
jgi:hypothetical protein